jgi:3-oxoacyl-[acyl-carrier protein] reductase
MDLGLDGKVAMVAAGTSGIGLAIAAELAAQGATVTVCGRSPDRLRAALIELRTVSANAGGTAGGTVDGTAGGTVDGACVDVTNHAAVRDWVDQTAARHGGPHIVVANAGSPPEGGAGRFSAQDYRDALELNLLSGIALVTAALPGMRRAGHGRVLFVTSLAAKQPIPGLALSNTVRPAVLGYAKALIHELAAEGEHGITVNVLAPGMTRTPALEAWAAELDGGVAGLVTGIPLARLAEPAEVGAVAAFLASARAGFVTGVVLPVDGGASRGLL